MYVDGVCPENDWHFPYESAPSLLAVWATVRRQRQAPHDPFSRLSSRRGNGSTNASTPASRPVSPSLYTAALLTRDALQTLEARELCARENQQAGCAGRLLKARELLEAVAKTRKNCKASQGMPPMEDVERGMTTAGKTAEVSKGEPVIKASKQGRTRRLLQHWQQTP